MAPSGILSYAEDVSDQILRKSKHFLPHIARFCIVSTFLEDGLRMWTQWDEQREYMNDTWSCGWFIATAFVIINLLGQLIGSGMVLIRKQVVVACGILFAIIFIQTIGYSILWDLRFLLRNMALIGGIVLLLAESKSEGGRRIFAGVPNISEPNKPKTYMQLSGRLLLVLMYLTLFSTSTIWQTIFSLICMALVLLVAVGFKTKLSAFVLVLSLLFWNMYWNRFWTYKTDRPMFDFVKYDFFQTLSVIGGLLLVVALGPGGVSLDEYKKDA